MRIYAYVSGKSPNIVGFTGDETGGNLPDKYAPWTPRHDGRAVATGDGTDPVSAVVQRDGYFIAANRSVR